MKSRIIDLIVTLMLGGLAISLPIDAQQATRTPKVGFLSAYSATAHQDRVQAFRQGLRDLGYVVGRNVIVAYRYAEGKRDQMAVLAAELLLRFTAAR